MNELPVVIINPANQRQVYQGLADEWTALEPPIWARLLASYLDFQGIPVEIYDQQTMGGPIPDGSLYVITVFGNQPSASTQTMPAAVNVCNALEPTAVKLVIGGHPAALPKETLIETNADFVCTGEGFITTRDLFHFIHTTKFWRELTPPNGLVYWGDDKTILWTRPAENVRDLFEIPGDMWDKLPPENYRAHNWHANFQSDRSPYASIYTTWGCPFSCSFCMIQTPFREGDTLTLKGLANSYRRWPAGQIATEIEHLVAFYHVKHIKIVDEMFLLNRKHVTGIVEELEKRGISEKDVNFWFYSRVDTVGTDEKLLNRMSKCGFKWAVLGIESGVGDVLNKVEKRDYENLDVVGAVRKLQGAGINVLGNFIFGLPGDTLESMQDTYEFAEFLKCEFVNFYSAVAYPGSPMFAEMIGKGWKPPPWSTYSFHSYDHQPLGTDTLSSADVLKFRDEAFLRYMGSEWYLDMIKEKFGVEACYQIGRMAATPLRRQLLDGR